MSDTSQNSAANKSYFDRAIYAIKQLGFPIVIAVALLYIQNTTLKESVQMLRESVTILKEMNQQLSEIDNKLTLIFAKRGASISQGEIKQ